jgi:hypothetical protein
MNSQLSAYPWPWNVIAYSILGIGWIVTVVFIAWYMKTEPWSQTETGRHLVSFSASVGAFFTLYLLLALFPDLPGKGLIRIVLLIVLVGNCVWRLILFARYRRDERRAIKSEGVE